MGSVAKSRGLLDSEGKKNRELEGRHEWERVRMSDRLRYGRRAGRELRYIWLVFLKKKKKRKEKLRNKDRIMQSVQQRAIRNSLEDGACLRSSSP